MKYIPRQQLALLKTLNQSGKVVVIYGARRVGKTTLIQKYIESYEDQNRILFVTGDDITVREYLESQSIQKLKDFVGQNKLLIIDEAQSIRNIGLNLKLLIDHQPNLQIIATGSSSFDLSKEVGEPLTGRKTVLKLHPIAQMELSEIENVHDTRANLESRLVYGSYPEIITMQDNENRKLYLRDLVRDYLFKDILELEGIRHSDRLQKLLQLLAFQIGREVSTNELGQQLGMSKNTVIKYLDLLEKVFVIYHRSGFSKNFRKEISKSNRYYFYDNGIRNAIIHQFNPLNIRDDVGMLWENYIITERLKRNEYQRQLIDSYFWRTYDKQEIDLIENDEGSLAGYETKWNQGKIKLPGGWKTNYADASFEVIHQNNYLQFIQ